MTASLGTTTSSRAQDSPDEDLARAVGRGRVAADHPRLDAELRLSPAVRLLEVWGAASPEPSLDSLVPSHSCWLPS